MFFAGSNGENVAQESLTPKNVNTFYIFVFVIINKKN